ncbi:MAG: beta-propeller fold lactonase family protein [Pirellulaceae bacterium]
MNVKLFVRIALLAALVFHSATGFAAPARAAEDEASSQPLRFVVSVGGESRLARFTLDAESGEVSSLEEFKLSGAPGAEVLSRDGRRLYVALRSTNSVAALRVDEKSGALTLLGETPLDGNPTYLAIDQTGKHLLSAYYSGGQAAIHPIGDDGVVVAKPTSVVATKKNPHSILIDAKNNVVYVPNTGADVIKQYTFDADAGTLTPHATPEVATEAGDGPRHLWFHPTAPVMYFVNEKSSSVTAYTRDKTGVLSKLQNLSTLPADFDGRNTCADVELSPDGAFLYASNRGHDSLAGFRVDAETGKLTPIGNFPTEATPRSFNISPDGRYLVAAGQGSGKLAVYRRDQATGKLERISTREVGKSPSWVQFLP